MLEQPGLIKHQTDDDGKVHTKPLFPALGSVVDLVSTSSYILRAFFSRLLSIMQNHSQILFVILALIGAWLVAKYTTEWFSTFVDHVLSWISCSVSMSVMYTPFHNLRLLLSSKKTFKIKSKLLGETAWQMWYKDRDPRLYQDEGLSGEMLLLFEETEAEIFFHRSRAFAVTLNRVRKQATDWTLGTSKGPIQILMRDAHYHSSATAERETDYYSGRSGEDSWPWRFQNRRRARPIGTLDVEEATKAELLHEVSEYLSVTTKKWYRHRSIPYRRGYLFHG